MKPVIFPLFALAAVGISTPASADGDAAICVALQRPDFYGRYALARVDLNNDGRREVVAYLLDQNFCGSGGCTMVILTPSGSAYRRIGNTPTTRLPIRLLPSRHNGWRDIATDVRGHGFANERATVAYNGYRYLRQAGPPAASGGPTLISEATPVQRCPD